MSQRVEAKDSPDDFPTPPWATRALMEYVIGEAPTGAQTCLEPACGAGHMAKVLREYFGGMECADAYNYGYGAVRDFLTFPYKSGTFDWVITNPPFRLAEDFLIRGLQLANTGVAILARTVFLESVGRYNAIFQTTPPTTFAQFVERVPMVRGRLDDKATTATGYAWFVWDKCAQTKITRLVWIPPCRRSLERQGDYRTPQPIKTATRPYRNELLPL
jgi:hypothetical protein